MKYYISLLLSIFLVGASFAQTPKKEKIKLQNFDFADRSPDAYEGNNLLHGNVIIEYKGDILYADSAVYYQNKNFVTAWSNVRIVSKDKTITAHKIDYDGVTSIVKAFKDVVLRDAKSTLTADFVEYNRITEIAHATGNVKITDPANTIDANEMFYNRKSELVTIPGTYKTISADGTLLEGKDIVYNVKDKSAVFNSEVFITDKDYTIYSRKMTTNDMTGVTTFRDYSKITRRNDPSQYIITTDGDFNKKTGEAWLRKNSQLFYQGKMLTADKLYFNDKKGFGKGEGNVFLDDPQEKRFLRGDYGEAFRYLDSAYVTKNAYAVKAFEKDSLYIHADTLLAVRRHDKDSTTLIRAYNQARFFKSNANGKADSIIFNQTKGTMEFHKDPIVWSGENQVTGDFIESYLNTKTEKLDSIKVLNNAFVISRVDSISDKEFHQIKGKELTVLFFEDQIDYLDVEGNAVALTYMDDEDEKTKVKERYGVNISYCGIIEADVVGKDLELVACRIKSDGKMYPLSKFPDELRFLPDFNWRINERFLKWQDIFVTSK